MLTTPLAPRSLRPPLLERLTDEQWVRIDVVVAGLLLAVAVSHLIWFPELGSAASVAGSRWLLAPLYVAATVPIAVRRRWPLTALALTCAAVGVTTVLGHSLAPAPLLALPLYTVTMTYPRRRSLAALIAVEVTTLVSIALAALFGHMQGDVTFNILLALATWFVADSWRTRRVYLLGLAEQEGERQRREIEGARRAIVEERLEIARELHDVVAHSLSVIAVQSGVGRHVIDTQPLEARKALLAVETTSRSALNELRRVLGVLRRDGDEVARAPAPTMTDLGELVERVRATGVVVEVNVEGSGGSLPQGLELSLYRIVQEALTNVVKHAHGAPASVGVRYDDDEVVIEVLNGLAPVGCTRAADPSDRRDHHGIVGMHERASAFGGSLVAGERSEGGFRVLARFPTRVGS